MSGFQALSPTLELCCSSSQGQKMVRHSHQAAEARSHGGFFGFVFFLFLNGGGKLLISIENLLLRGKRSP